MIACIGNQLRGGIEAHGLAVDDGRTKGRGIVKLQPRGNINKFGKTGGVRFGEAVLAKTADLAKDLIGKLFVESFLSHPCQEFFLELFDHARFSPRAHRAAQLVGLARSETGCDDGQFHGLFLKDGDAQRAVQNRFDFIVGVDHLLLAVAAPQKRMHHVALNRPGPDDGYFDHQVVPASGLQPRQHAHLSATFDLKNADRVRLANHIVDFGIFLGHGRQRQMLAPMLPHQLKTLANRSQHPQAKTIDFQQPEFFQIVFVPLDHGAIIHGRIFDRHQFIQLAARDDHAANVLRQMTGEANDFVDQVIQLLADSCVGIDPHVRASGR